MSRMAVAGFVLSLVAIVISVIELRTGRRKREKGEG